MLTSDIAPRTAQTSIRHRTRTHRTARKKSWILEGCLLASERDGILLGIGTQSWLNVDRVHALTWLETALDSTGAGFRLRLKRGLVSGRDSGLHEV